MSRCLYDPQKGNSKGRLLHFSLWKFSMSFLNSVIDHLLAELRLHCGAWAVSSCGERGRSAAAVGGARASPVADLSSPGSVVRTYGPRCPEAGGSNPRPLHRKADSQPLDPQRSPSRSLP